MANPFAAFDHQHLIQHAAGAAASYATGSYVAGNASFTPVTGHVILIDRRASTDWIQREVGVMEEGTTLFGTYDSLTVDGLLRIHDDDTGNNYRDFRVTELLHRHAGIMERFTGQVRNIYRIMEEIDGK